MTLLLDEAKKRGTHAIVIGVGRYPWLERGGAKPRFDKSEGMGQLTSPPASAREFANWLLHTYDNPDAPLASVDLLLSDANSQQFKHGKKRTKIDTAEFGNVADAIDRWAARAKHEEDLLMFFFSGHGISAGNQVTLLCEDFGSKSLAPMRHAIDFTAMHMGLDRVASRCQCFFVDACRVGTSAILDSFKSYGQAIIEPQAAHNPRPRKTAVFHSTLPGQLAYGRKGKPSYFTEALLRAMRGAGSDSDDDVTWWVETGQLLRALPKVMPRIVRNADEIPPQPSTTDMSPFPLHRLPGPPAEIPVEVECDPAYNTADAILSCTGGAVNKKRNKKSAERWPLDLDAGKYTFRAAVTGQQDRELRDFDIRPTYRLAKVKV
jgi:hypothetical protein